MPGETAFGATAQTENNDLPNNVNNIDGTSYDAAVSSAGIEVTESTITDYNTAVAEQASANEPIFEMSQAEAIDSSAFAHPQAGDRAPQTPPEEILEPTPGLDAQGEAMRRIIDETAPVENLGNALNEGAQVPATLIEAGLELPPVASVDELVSELPPAVDHEAVKAELGPLAASIDQAPEGTKEKILEFINTGQYKLEQLANTGLGWAFGKTAALGEERGTFSRFMKAMSESYTERNRDLDLKMEQDKEILAKGGAGSKILNRAGYGLSAVGGLMKYGRIATDWLGVTAAAWPARAVSSVAALAERGFTAGKEASLKNEEWQKQVEKGRGGESEADIAAAYDEAVQLMEEAKSRVGGGEVTGKELQKVFSEGLPQDLLERLAQHEEQGDFAGQKLIHKMMEGWMRGQAGKWKYELDQIDNDPALSEEEKQTKRQAYLARFGRMRALKDFDRMITGHGAMNYWAMGARLGANTAKAATIGLMMDSFRQIYNKFADISVAGDGIAESVLPSAGASEVGGVTAGPSYQPFEASYPLDAATESVVGTTASATDMMDGGTPNATLPLGENLGLGQDTNGLDLPPDYQFPVDTSGDGMLSPVEMGPQDLVTIKSGDSLTSVLSESTGLSKQETFRVLDSLKNPEVYHKLGVNSYEEALVKLGVTTNNADLIHPEDTINAGFFREAITASNGVSPIAVSEAASSLSSAQSLPPLEQVTPSSIGGVAEVDVRGVGAPLEQGTPLPPDATIVATVEASGAPMTPEQRAALQNMDIEYKSTQTKSAAQVAQEYLQEQRGSGVRASELEPTQWRQAVPGERLGPDVSVTRAMNPDGTITETHYALNGQGQAVRTTSSVFREDGNGGRWIISQELNVSKIQDPESVAYAQNYMNTHGGRPPSVGEYADWHNEQMRLRQIPLGSNERIVPAAPPRGYVGGVNERVVTQAPGQVFGANERVVYPGNASYGRTVPMPPPPPPQSPNIVGQIARATAQQAAAGMKPGVARTVTDQLGRIIGNQ